MEILQEWWVWVVGGLVLAVLEVMVSGYVLLGLAAGAVLTGVMTWLGLFGAGLSARLLVWALASLASWLILRRMFGLPRDQVRIIHHDINSQ